MMQVPHREDAPCCPATPSPRDPAEGVQHLAELCLTSVGLCVGQEEGSAPAVPTSRRHAPCSMAVSTLHCPLNRFESAFALLSSISSCLKLVLAPWG